MRYGVDNSRGVVLWQISLLGRPTGYDNTNRVARYIPMPAVKRIQRNLYFVLTYSKVNGSAELTEFLSRMTRIVL